MTQSVPNQQSPLVDPKTGLIVSPWNSFFQQFTQVAPKVVTATSPYTPNTHGNLILTGAGSITLSRGNVSINLTGQRIIPIAIGDTVSWSGGTAQFLES